MPSDLRAGRKTDMNTIERKLIDNGHSSPRMAGAFARKINAKTLILTHFSNRFEAFQSMHEVVDVAKDAFRNKSVIAATDFYKHIVN